MATSSSEEELEHQDRRQDSRTLERLNIPFHHDTQQQPLTVTSHENQLSPSAQETTVPSLPRKFRECGMSVFSGLFEEISLSNTYHRSDEWSRVQIELSRLRSSTSQSSSSSQRRRGCMIIRKQEESLDPSTCKMYLDLHRKRRSSLLSKRTALGQTCSVDSTEGEDPTRAVVLSKKSSVTFKKVEIQSYQNIMGDHPAGSTGGPPLTIEWDPFQTSVYLLEDFERVREDGRRSFGEMLMPARHRVDLILRDEEVSMMDIVRNKREMEQVKLERKKTTKLLHRARFEERLEICRRMLKNTIFSRREKKEERKYLARSREIQEAQNLEADNLAMGLLRYDQGDESE